LGQPSVGDKVKNFRTTRYQFSEHRLYTFTHETHAEIDTEVFKSSPFSIKSYVLVNIYLKKPRQTTNLTVKYLSPTLGCPKWVSY